jgi:pyruvate formate-lyase activating enzyme-like uncharacterized protein
MQTYTGRIMKHDTISGSFYMYLPTGCRLCYKGAKMVLFVTGLCRMNCFYCPVSEEKKNKDVIFANERPVYFNEDIVTEARSMRALGTGITGGEPLIVLQRVLEHIRLLKNTFGRSHHIHLYTSQSPDKKILTKLKTAGLDEIRFHPPLEMWDNLAGCDFVRSITWAKELDLEVGIEVPSIPEISLIADFACEHDVFLNLNELEFSHSNAAALKDRGFIIKNDETCGTKGSREVALKIIEQYSDLRAHYCSSCFKDAVQLRLRLGRTAQTTARKFDEITPDGTLFYGVIRGDVNEIIRFLTECKVPEDLYDPNLSRVELGWWVLDDIAQDIDSRFTSWYEECYPTYGRMIVEKIPLTEQIIV